MIVLRKESDLDTGPVCAKKETGIESPILENVAVSIVSPTVIDIESSSESSCSSSESFDGSDNEEEDEDNPTSPDEKGTKIEGLGALIPIDFLTPLPPLTVPVSVVEPVSFGGRAMLSSPDVCRQFWKAGDYVGYDVDLHQKEIGRMEHVRVHPKFLHSNATSHKWALGAFAELLDNSLDEVPNGATYVNVDVLENTKDGRNMLLVEDDGGGMDPEKIRHCMSLGFSAKSKLANTIGQYGNGFKTSTMRLGADVIVFSRCSENNGKSATQSVGLLSYTFLRSTGKEDIVVPMLDFERHGLSWKKMVRSTVDDWDRNMTTIIEWSPFHSETDLVNQFNLMSNHGTKIIIYNLWEDDEGLLELDFTADCHDIQLRGVNRDDQKIQLADKCPNSRHFLTYKHSLRSYASILYLRLPEGFRIILRGKDVPHHNIVDDMMMSQEVTYRPQVVPEGVTYMNITAVVTIGFVKDAKHHIDVQGFNVYHKNRLIKPFWRLWNCAGSDGRGVIGVLEANFVEPAHDKQGFERTTILARLEARLINMQKNYWCTHCHLIGYAPRRSKKGLSKSSKNESYLSSGSKRKRPTSIDVEGNELTRFENGDTQLSHKSNISGFPCLPSPESSINYDLPCVSRGDENNMVDKQSTKSMLESNDLRIAQLSPSSQCIDVPIDRSSGREIYRSVKLPQSTCAVSSASRGGSKTLSNASPALYLHDEVHKRLDMDEMSALSKVGKCENCESLENKLRDALLKVESLTKDKKSLNETIAEERRLSSKEEERLRKKIKEASESIESLLDKVISLERNPLPLVKTE